MQRELEATKHYPDREPSIGMPKLIRNQHDDLGDVMSEATATTPEGESLTRQEFKEDTDINTILARFGVNTQVRNDMVFTETDYTVDLQAAHDLMQNAKQVNTGVPPELRDKYPNWLALMSGIERGEYQNDLRELAEKRGAAARRQDLEKRAQDLRDRRDAERELAAQDAAAAVREGKETPKP